MYRNATTGYYEEDFRRKGIARLHVSYGVKKKDEAKPASDALHRIFRERRVELIEKVRRGEVSPHQIAALIADDKPLSTASIVAATAPWPTVRTAADEYVEWLVNNDRKSKETADTAKAQLNRFVEFVGAEKPVDQVTTSMVLDYQRQLYAEEAAQNTVVAYVWRVSGMYTWLVRRERTEARDHKRPPRDLHIPIDREEVTTRKTRRERFLLEAEAERLIAATPTMLLFPVLAGLLGGLRIGETVHLRPGFDVDTRLWLFTIQEQPDWHPKNRKRRVVPIAPQLRPVVEYHLKQYASEQWMLPSAVHDARPMSDKTLDIQFQRIVENAELVKGRTDPRGVVYHTLRHTFASWLVMRGVDLYTVSQLLGNSVKQVEQTYAHLAPDFRQRAVDKLTTVVAVPGLPEEGASDV